MKKLLFLFYVYFLIFIPSHEGVSIASAKRIAILDFEAMNVIDPNLSRTLSDNARAEFVKSKQYEVIDRIEVKSKVAIQVDKCFSTDCAIDIGQTLKLDKVVIGSVNVRDKTYSISLTLIDVASREVDFKSEEACKCEVDELIPAVKRAAEKILASSVEQKPLKGNIAKDGSNPLSYNNALTPEERFIFSELTVLDAETKLMWTRNGDLADGRTTWGGAKRFVTNVNSKNHAEYHDWRIPTREEFNTLLEYAKAQGVTKLYGAFFNNIGFKNVQGFKSFNWKTPIYITSTEHCQDWVFNIKDGVIELEIVDGKFFCSDGAADYVWLVRGGE